MMKQFIKTLTFTTVLITGIMPAQAMITLYNGETGKNRVSVRLPQAHKANGRFVTKEQTIELYQEVFGVNCIRKDVTMLRQEAGAQSTRTYYLIGGVIIVGIVVAGVASYMIADLVGRVGALENFVKNPAFWTVWNTGKWSLNHIIKPALSPISSIWNTFFGV